MAKNTEGVFNHPKDCMGRFVPQDLEVKEKDGIFTSRGVVKSKRKPFKNMI